MEGFRDQKLPLIVTFVDFGKALDSIYSSVMSSVRRHYGIPETLVSAIQVFYTNYSSSVMVYGSIYRPFRVSIGVLKGDVLALLLFIILVDYLLLRTSDGDSGVLTCPRKSRRYPAKVLNDLDFADEIASLQSSISPFPVFHFSIPSLHCPVPANKKRCAAADIGVVISASKTEYIVINCPQPPLEVYGSTINHGQDFK